MDYGYGIKMVPDCGGQIASHSIKYHYQPLMFLLLKTNQKEYGFLYRFESSNDKTNNTTKALY